MLLNEYKLIQHVHFENFTVCVCVRACTHACTQVVKETEMDVTLRGKLCFLKGSSLKPIVNFLSTAFTGAPE